MLNPHHPKTDEERLAETLVHLAHKLNQDCANRIESDGEAHAYKGYEIRDETGLIGAIHSVFQHVFGQPTYPGIYERAAALMFKVVDCHAFGDGNKRTALHLSVTYLRAVGIRVVPPSFAVGADLVSDLAEKKMTIIKAADCLREWTIPDGAAVAHQNFGKTSRTL